MLYLFVFTQFRLLKPVPTFAGIALAAMEARRNSCGSGCNYLHRYYAYLTVEKIIGFAILKLLGSFLPDNPNAECTAPPPAVHLQSGPLHLLPQRSFFVSAFLRISFGHAQVFDSTSQIYDLTFA